jgi:hypothetical protein
VQAHVGDVLVSIGRGFDLEASMTTSTKRINKNKRVIKLQKLRCQRSGVLQYSRTKVVSQSKQESNKVKLWTIRAAQIRYLTTCRGLGKKSEDLIVQPVKETFTLRPNTLIAKPASSR